MAKKFGKEFVFSLADHRMQKLVTVVLNISFHLHYNHNNCSNLYTLLFEVTLIVETADRGKLIANYSLRPISVAI